MYKSMNNSEDAEVRKGPWTMEEDLILTNYIATHGECVWNTLAKAAGLKRTGKSCRLRWLNYLRPDVRRGNITPEEQLLIMDLHSRWGNRSRWSQIARQLPGRTDNEIKNYWRTRIQKKVKGGESSECQTSMIFDDASTSQTSGTEDGSAQPSHTDLNQNANQDASAPLITESCDSFWSFEDFWAMQPHNGD